MKSPVKKLVNLAATPAPRLIQAKDIYTQKLNYENFYGRPKEETFKFEKGAIHTSSLKAGNLS